MKNDKFLQKTFQTAPDFVSRIIADETILVPIRSSASDVDYIFCLNEIATRIWELLDGEKQVKEIRDTIVSEFEVDLEKAEAELADFLQQLQSVGAIRNI